MQCIARLEPETIERIIEGKADLTAVLKDYQNRERETTFLNSFNAKIMTDEGLSKELLEWLLVSHRVLLPQLGG